MEDSRIFMMAWCPVSCISLLPDWISFGKASSLKYLTPLPPLRNWTSNCVWNDVSLIEVSENSSGNSMASQITKLQASLQTAVLKSLICFIITGWIILWKHDIVINFINLIYSFSRVLIKGLSFLYTDWLVTAPCPTYMFVNYPSNNWFQIDYY